MITFNGLPAEDLKDRISNGLERIADKDNDKLNPGELPEFTEIQMDYGTILHMLSASIAQIGPQSRAFELRLQKNELTLQKLERRLVTLEGKIEGMHGVATDASEKLNFLSREFGKLKTVKFSATHIEQAMSDFSGRLLAALEGALITSDEVRMMRLDVQNMLERIATEVNGNPSNG